MTNSSFNANTINANLLKSTQIVNQRFNSISKITNKPITSSVRLNLSESKDNTKRNYLRSNTQINNSKNEANAKGVISKPIDETEKVTSTKANDLKRQNTYVDKNSKNKSFKLKYQ